MRDQSSQLRKPDFLIAGAQKSGTSWLFRRLQAHPEIFLPKHKDQEFFSYRDALNPTGFSRYFERFSSASPGQTVGDVNGSYFWTKTGSRWSSFPKGFNTDIPGSVRAALGPDLKLIFCLRNPVERALSAYAHYVAHGEISPLQTFADSLSYVGVFDMGLYATHLGHWLEHYPLEQCLILTLEGDIAANPQDTISKVEKFMGLDSHPVPFAGIVFPGTPRRVDENGWVHFQAPKHRPERLVPKKAVSAHMIDYIKNLYHPEVQRLEALSGIELTDLWQF